ncbi:hypothetical protein OT109_05615 [Phycisphaeraceae bacterium D3-23]
MKSDTVRMRWWPLPAFFYILHGIVVLIFGVSSAALTGPNADAGSMVWLLWVLVDFPIGYAAVMIADDASTNGMAIAIVALIGGIQWIIWGLAVTLVIRMIQTWQAKRQRWAQHRAKHPR